MVVIAVIEPAHLLSVHPVIGGVEIQDQTPRWALIRGDELLHQNLVQSNRLGAPGMVLKTAQGRGAGQRPIFLYRRLQRQVPAQLVVVV